MSDLHDLFEAQLGPMPASPSVDSRIADGKRALRQRRTARVGTGVVVALCAVGLWQSGVVVPFMEAESSVASQEAVVEPVQSAAQAIPVGSHEVLAEHRGEGVFFDLRSGQLFREPGASVARTVNQPTESDETKSVALEVSVGDETRWMYLTWSAGRSSWGYDVASTDASFEGWLRELRPGALTHSLSEQMAQPIGKDGE